MYYRKYSLLSNIPRWCSRSGVPCGCMNRIHLWLHRRDGHSGVQIGASVARRSDWPARVWTNDERRCKNTTDASY